MQTDIGQRLDRQFGEAAASLLIVEGKVDGLGTRLGCIESSRREEALLATERQRVAAKDETEHADKAAQERADAKDAATNNNADRAAHSLSHNQRLAIGVAAISGVGGLALGIVTTILRVAGILK
jgi:hypothetical protein